MSEITFIDEGDGFWGVNVAGCFAGALVPNGEGKFGPSPMLAETFNISGDTLFDTKEDFLKSVK